MPRYLTEPSRETRAFAAGLKLPLRIDCEIIGLADDGDPTVCVDLEMGIELKDRRFVCTDLRIKKRSDGPAITGELLREVRVHEILRDLVQLTVMRINHDRCEGEKVFVDLADHMRPPEGTGKRGADDETLRWVAQAYEVAYALNEPPTKSVQTALGVSRATAGRWVAEARRRGMLHAGEDS